MIGQDTKGGDGITAEADTHIKVTVGGGPLVAEVPDLRDERPRGDAPEAGPWAGNPERPGLDSPERRSATVLRDKGRAGRSSGGRRRKTRIKAAPNAFLGRLPLDNRGK
jgi:hypothetical protein